MAIPLARRNLLHDRVRFAVTLTGIVFSVLLSSIQLGLFVGFTRATSEVITHSGADIWVSSRGVTHLETGVPFPERTRFQVLAVPGVSAAERHLVQFGNWTRPDGAVEGILLVGFDLDGALGGPWSLVEGRAADLEQADAVIVDELYRAKLGVHRLGETFEIRGHRARVVGFTRGIRSFTTAPPVFTSFANAQRFMDLASDRTVYLLVRTADGADPSAIASRIETSVAHVDARPTAEWSRTQQNYWMFGTGAGITVLIAAGLGLLVGIVVVAQTIYAATVDHIREFGTLKAMGGSHAYLYRVIVTQAVIAAVVGYGVGMTLAQIVAALSQRGTTAIILPWPLTVGLFVITVTMCVAASLVSINKVTRLDPAMVFKG
jgi:putative ABC transport system permease protein